MVKLINAREADRYVNARGDVPRETKVDTAIVTFNRKVLNASYHKPSQLYYTVDNLNHKQRAIFVQHLVDAGYKVEYAYGKFSVVIIISW